MHRLISTLRKEFQIVIRDRTGLALIFIMPMLLVFIMTLLQHEAYRSLNESGVPVLLINNDTGELGQGIESEFVDFPLCKLTVDHGYRFNNKQQIEEAVLDGEFVVAVIIPSGSSNKLKADVSLMLDAVMDDTPIDKSILKQVEIDIISDPVAKKSFVMAVNSGLREFIASVKTQVLFRMMADKMKEITGGENSIEFPSQDFFLFNEKYAHNIASSKIYQPNAVQHNVPAWAIFSIFFILIPLAGSVIRERSIGLYTRLRTIPGSYLSILSGKLFLYFLIALVQLIAVMLIGKYCLPIFGLPELLLGNAVLPFIVLSAVVAMTAVSYGLLLGTIFDTAPQASIFGGISILIFSAIGGIWVPVNIMPEIMQKLTIISPLSWALNGYYELFIKGGGWADIQHYIVRLILFISVMFIVSYQVYVLKRKFI